MFLFICILLTLKCFLPLFQSCVSPEDDNMSLKFTVFLVSSLNHVPFTWTLKSIAHHCMMLCVFHSQDHNPGAAATLFRCCDLWLFPSVSQLPVTLTIVVLKSKEWTQLLCILSQTPPVGTLSPTNTGAGFSLHHCLLSEVNLWSLIRFWIISGGTNLLWYVNGVWSLIKCISTAKSISAASCVGDITTLRRPRCTVKLTYTTTRGHSTLYSGTSD